MVRTSIVWSDELVGYDFGAGHPMAPVRLMLTVELLRAMGVFDLPDVEVRPAPVAEDRDLHRVHTSDYVEAVRAAGEDGVAAEEIGLGTPDNPLFAEVHTASARIVGSTLTAARAVWEEAPGRAFSLAGGLHHAMAAKASGFCVYNDVAAAIAWLLEAGAARIAYVDHDAHHGDGVERAFWDDPRVLTVSVHQHPGTLFPGTGYPHDVGGSSARGSAVNVALPAGTSDADWLRAVEAVAAPLVEHHRPDVLVTQHGCDCHGNDPLTELEVSIDAQRRAALLMSELADAHAGGRWLATGGGGYDVVGVVPRVWTHLAAVVAGHPIDPETPIPEAWRRAVLEVANVDVPATMSDGGTSEFARFADGYNPDDPVDRAIMATRQAVFPWHGLDPMPD
ncbi:acetoin utilization protein AcuC [Georgenia halophila]|uniref:Acetoin utilization protein AcuC n=1 Tax=Georgenia halophila TaxID=620889 RepID=A0ABP8KZ01_9MICO